MQTVPRLRNLLNSASSGAFPATQLSSFHSTAVCDDKRKKKWNSGPNRGQHQETPSKNYIRYVTREKRADAKRALKSLLFNGGAFESPSQNEDRSRRKKDKKDSQDSELEDDADSSTKTGRSETRRSQRIKSKQRRKQRRGYVTEDDEHHETAFQAKFGNRWYTWSFNPFHSPSFYSSTSGFDWNENAHKRNDRRRRFEAASDIESDDDSGGVGSHSDRTILGLPLHGPLKIEDVKSAFRLAALKWHPDKHQGPSQAHAEEKFKVCVNAYKSLCNSLSAA